MAQPPLHGCLALKPHPRHHWDCPVARGREDLGQLTDGLNNTQAPARSEQLPCDNPNQEHHWKRTGKENLRTTQTSNSTSVLPGLEVLNPRSQPRWLVFTCPPDVFHPLSHAVFEEMSLDLVSSVLILSSTICFLF